MGITSFYPHTLTETAYRTLRYDILLDTEGFGDSNHPGEIYFDSVGIASIGIGFNMLDSVSSDAVIKYFFTGDPNGALLSQDLVFLGKIESIITESKRVRWS